MYSYYLRQTFAIFGIGAHEYNKNDIGESWEFKV